jgi:flagellar hook-basal body protein
MDVIGNNIANVNTYGYKTSRATFSDVYYQTIRAARPGDADRGGQNPTQVGYGAQLATIDILMGNGGGSYTGRAMDVYIDGDGFLTVQDADGVFHFTRLGNMSIIDNRLVDSSGNFIMGINLDTEPTVDTITAAAEDAAAAAEALALAKEAAEDAAEAVVDAAEALDEANIEATGKAAKAATAKETADKAKAVNKAAQKIAEAAQAYLTAVDASDTADAKAIADAKVAVAAAKAAATAAQNAANAITPGDSREAAADAAALAATNAANDADNAVNNPLGVSVADLNDILSDAAKAISEATKAVAALDDEAAAVTDAAVAKATEDTEVARESLQTANTAAVAEVEAYDDFETENAEAIADWEAAELAAVNAGALTGTPPTYPATVAAAQATYDQAVLDAAAALDAVEATVGLDSTDPGYAAAATALIGSEPYDTQAAALVAANDDLTDADLVLKATVAKDLTTTAGVIAKAEETATAYAAAESLYEAANAESKEADAAARIAKVAHETAIRNANSTATKAEVAAEKAAQADAIATVPPSGYATGKSVEPSGEGGFWTEDDMSAITFGLATISVTGDDGTETEMELDVIDCITNINIGPDGKIYGITMRDFTYGPNDEMFQKDEVIYLGQLAVALFPNQDGLSQTGMSQYDPSASSGNAQFTTADLNGAGGTNSGYLEMSNVELSQQFTDMITTQRGFQANSRIVTVSDEMLQELINMKR